MKAKKVNEYLTFSDGEKFDTSGPLRAEERYDGWYVIGNGTLIPVESEAEANSIIDNMKPDRHNSRSHNVFEGWKDVLKPLPQEEIKKRLKEISDSFTGTLDEREGLKLYSTNNIIQWLTYKDDLLNYPPKRVNYTHIPELIKIPESWVEKHLDGIKELTENNLELQQFFDVFSRVYKLTDGRIFIVSAGGGLMQYVSLVQ